MIGSVGLWYLVDGEDVGKALALYIRSSRCLSGAVHLRDSVEYTE